MSHVFGPVQSRRLGRSLGIDLIPHKTCNWNCVYCQLGRTRPVTNTRREYVSTEILAWEIQQAVQTCRDKVDWITFVGSGEPSLHIDIGWLIRKVKEATDVPVAVITNGSLLYLRVGRIAHHEPGRQMNDLGTILFHFLRSGFNVSAETPIASGVTNYCTSRPW